MRTDSILDFYTDDHQKLIGDFLLFRRLKVLNDHKAAKQFNKFYNHLKRHLWWEEDILCPLFNTKTQHRYAADMAYLARQRSKIFMAVEDLKYQMKEDNDTWLSEVFILSLLTIHHEKEEKLFLPALEQLLLDEERESIFEWMRADIEEPVGCSCQSSR